MFGAPISTEHALARRRTSAESLEDMVDIAITECERFFPAFQFVLWGGKAPNKALTAAMLECVGEARSARRIQSEKVRGATGRSRLGWRVPLVSASMALVGRAGLNRHLPRRGYRMTNSFSVSDEAALNAASGQ